MFIKVLCRLALVVGAGLAWGIPASAEPASPPVGTYVRSRATGTLTVERSSLLSPHFSIDSIGANGHSCTMRGTLKDGIGRVDAAANSSAATCSITFEQTGSAWSVRSATTDACRASCGVRADFEGAYLPQPAACTPDARKAMRATFDKQYKESDYANALATLNALRARCAHFMNWVETDWVRNDLAITQYHLGQNAECLATLKLAFAATVTDEEALKAALPPADFKAYLTVARATWVNQGICRKAAR